MKPIQQLLQPIPRIKQKGIMLKNIIEKHKKLKNMKVLDIGCGNGFFEFALAPYVQHIIGVDPSPFMIQDAKLNNDILKYRNVLFLEGSLEYLFLKIRFDLVIFSYSLHYSLDVNKSLDIAIERVKKNGLLLIIEPTKTFFKGKLNKDSSQFDINYYRNKMNKLELTRNMIEKKFKNYKILHSIYNNEMYLRLIQF